MSFADALAVAARTRAVIAGVWVVYRRGALETRIRATRGRTQFDQLAEDGTVTRFESDDFLFPLAELLLDGEPTEPERGDTIQPECGDVVFHVVPGSEAKCFRYCDSFRIEVRVHTQRIT